MRISKVETIPVQIPLKAERRMISALGRHEVSRFVLVRLTTDDGLEGVGEATVTPRWSGETVWSAQSIIENVFKPVLIDCDPTDIDEIDRRLDAVAFGNWFAKAALELACWDLAGRKAGVPVYQLLGGPCRPLTIRSRFSMGAYPPEVAAERALERVKAGFDTIKVKVGTDPEQDISRVRSVREAIGPEIALTIDANGGWEFSSAMTCLEALADCSLTLVEQPLPRGNYVDLKRIKESTEAKILIDEGCFDEVEARELLLGSYCDALSLYPGKQGGIRKARRIANLAQSHQVPCSIGSNLEWDIGTAAMLHLIVSTPNMQVELYPGDCLGPYYHEFSIAKNPLKIEGPWTTLYEAPGLGIEVDWDLVERHRIVGPG